MTQTLEAIYEDKVLKPLTPIDGLHEHQHVEVTLTIPHAMLPQQDEEWYNIAAQGIEHAYGENEPEYTLSMLREQNPEYK